MMGQGSLPPHATLLHPCTISFPVYNVGCPAALHPVIVGWPQRVRGEAKQKVLAFKEKAESAVMFATDLKT